MKLRVVSGYACRDERYESGQTIIVDEQHGEWLMRDAPGAFRRVYESGPALVQAVGASVAETLAENGVHTLAQLRTKLAEGDDAVLALHGIGPATLADIKKALDGPPEDKMVRSSVTK